MGKHKKHKKTNEEERYWDFYECPHCNSTQTDHELYCKQIIEEQLRIKSEERRNVTNSKKKE